MYKFVDIIIAIFVGVISYQTYEIIVSYLDVKNKGINIFKQ